MFPMFFLMGGVQVITLTISSDKTAFNAFTEAGSPSGLVNLTVIVNAGVTVKGGTNSTALNLNSFAAGSTIDVQVSGKVLGKGGKGGTSGVAEHDVGGGICSAGTPNGGNGGHAISGDQAISLTVNAGGEVRGGSGGGGAGGGGGNNSSAASGGGGGGGRGADGGGKGTAGSSTGSPGSDGVAGSQSAGGAGGAGGSGGSVSGGNGGAGGNNWAQAGAAGAAATGSSTGSCPSSAGTGGSAGKAVSLSAGTTTLTDNGTVSGVVD